MVLHSNPDLASVLVGPTAEKIVQLEQKKKKVIVNLPKDFNSIKELGEYLKKNPLKITISENNQLYSLDSYLVESSKQGHHIILYDKDLINQFDSETEFFLDGTFKVVPKGLKGCKQLLTIMAKKFDKVHSFFLI